MTVWIVAVCGFLCAALSASLLRDIRDELRRMNEKPAAREEKL